MERYDYSEPQSGKDTCDRILCPMKPSIRLYCCEGHAVLTASDIKEALQQHPVKGTTTSVNVVDESKQDFVMAKLQKFGSYNNFKFEATGVRTWKADDVGEGIMFPYNTMCVTLQFTLEPFICDSVTMLMC